MTTGAGQRRERIAFEQRGDAGMGEWVERFTYWARVTPLRGGETVLAKRLTGVQPVVINVLASSQTRTVDATWRARDARTGVIYAIHSDIQSENRAEIDFMAEAGVAHG